MRKLNYSLLLLWAALCFTPILAIDTIRVKQTKIPILIEREDNVLFYFRIDASESEMLNELKFKISDNTNLDEIEAVKL